MAIIKTIYLAGPMENVSFKEACTWREYAKNRLSNCGFTILDPTRRIHNDEREYKRIFELDMLDVQHADLILVNLADPKLAKHGTAMEVFYANYMLRKPVVAFKDQPNVKHPFFEQLVTEWRSNVEDAVELIISEYY